MVRHFCSGTEGCECFS